LIGKIDLYHSCDREELAQDLAKISVAKNLTSNILIQINIGEENSKGGYAYEEAQAAYIRLSQTPGLRVKGFMAMLPEEGTEEYKRGLVRKMRNLFDWAKTRSCDVEYLSMGMSGDYALCVAEGANIIRVGSTIFGKRDYGKV
jgi:pyridoxal phosphate enzyme (YggS family)